jgi:hypothetical protein
MKRHLLIAAVAAALHLPGASFANPTEPADAFKTAPRISPEDAEAFADARIAALKAGLKLSSSQEKNWPVLETVLREVAKNRRARISEVRDQLVQRVARPDAIAALRQGAKLLSAHAADLEKLSDAAKPLYDSLDEAQKRRFGLLLRAAARHRALAFLSEFHKAHPGHAGFDME